MSFFHSLFRTVYLEQSVLTFSKLPVGPNTLTSSSYFPGPAMQPVINVVLPVFAIILTGYLAGRFKLLGDGSGDVLQRFVFYVAMPVLLFYAMARVDPAEIMNGPYLAAYLGGQAATFLIALSVAKLFFKRRLAESALNGMASIYGNTGYMGIPLTMAAFGPDWIAPAIIATFVNGALVMGVVAAIIEVDLSDGGAVLKVFRDVSSALFKNPMLVTPLLGFAWAFTGLGLADPVETFAKILGAAAGPCALFSIGLFLVGQSLRRDLMEVNWMVFLKLIIHPAITWVLAFHVFEMPQMWASICVVMAAVPTGANIFILARRYNMYVERTSTVILIATVVSTVTLSLLFSHWSDRLAF